MSTEAVKSEALKIGRPNIHCKARTACWERVSCAIQDIGVEKEANQSMTPTSRPIVLKVSVFDTPSMRKASR